MGSTLESCAVNIVAVLGLRPTCFHSVLEQLNKLVKTDEAVLHDAMLRLATEQERAAVIAAKETALKQAKRIKMRTAAKRCGGHRSLELRSTLPLTADR